MSVKSLALAAVAALCLSAAALPPAPVMAQTAVSASAPDSAKVALAEQIYDNLRIIEVLGTATARAITTDPDYTQELSPAVRAKLSQLFIANLTVAKPALLHKLATAHSSNYSIGQLTSVRNLSRIKYAQDLVARGADPSLPEPDITSMTPAERTIYDSVINQPFTSDFLMESTDFALISSDCNALAVDALQKLAEWRKTQPAGT